MSQTENRSFYSAGTQRIPTTYWRVERVYPMSFRTIGYIRVVGRTVEQEMDAHRSIHHHEPGDIARRIAGRRYPNVTVIVSPATEAQWRRWNQQ